MNPSSAEWWRPLAELVVVTPREPGYRYAEKPNDADLDRYEAESGVCLAAGYRGFVKTFGPGVFAVGEAGLRIQSPYCPNALFAIWAPRAGRESTADVSRLYPGQKPLFVFANDDGGHQYGWHPGEPTEPEGPEFRVYARNRHSPEMEMPMSRTFEGFIRLFTNQMAFRSRFYAPEPVADVKDPQFRYFRRRTGREITGPRGTPLDKHFSPAGYYSPH